MTAHSRGETEIEFLNHLFSQWWQLDDRTHTNEALWWNDGVV